MVYQKTVFVDLDNTLIKSFNKTPIILMLKSLNMKLKIIKYIQLIISSIIIGLTYPFNKLIALKIINYISFKGLTHCDIDHKYITDQLCKDIYKPILDRIDMTVFVKAIEIKKITNKHLNLNEKSKTIRDRIIRTRITQTKRYCDTNLTTNSQLNSKQVRFFCQLSPKAEKLLKRAAHKLAISTRSYFKIIKVAQTIADLEIKYQGKIKESHIAEALQYRKASL